MTTPEGNPDAPFDLCQLVVAAGAQYVARQSVFHIRQLIRVIETALQRPGFSFVEAITPCPVQYGRRNALTTPVAMLRELGERCVSLSRARTMTREQLAGWG